MDSLSGKIPLLLAVERGDVELVESLLSAGADPNLGDTAGMTPLSLASLKGNYSMVKVLLSYGARLDLRTPYPPLTMAIKGGNPEIVRELINRGMEVNYSDSEGITPLHLAARLGHAEIVKILLDKRGEVNIKDRYGMTPLMWGAWKGSPEIVKMLLEGGAEIEEKDREGMTALSLSAREGHQEVLKILLSQGANPDTPDRRGVTPVMWAAYRKHRAIVKLLGRDERVVSTLLSALHYPSEYRLWAVEALKILREKRAVEPLLELLRKEEDYGNQIMIITALGEIGDEGAIPLLMNKLKDDKLFKVVLSTLQKINSPQAIPYLRKFLYDKDKFPYVKITLLSLGDASYVQTWERTKYLLSITIPLVVLTFTGLGSLLTSRKKIWGLLRLLIGGLNGYLGFYMGLITGWVIMLVFKEEEVIIHGILFIFTGIYTAFFCILGSFLKLKEKKRLLNALFISSFPFLVSPVVAGKEILTFKVIFMVLAVSFTVFTNYLLLYPLLEYVRKKGGESFLDRLDYLSFSLILGGILLFIYSHPLLHRMIMWIIS